MEESSFIKFISDPLKIGSLLGGIFMGIKIFLNFDTKKVLKKFHKDDDSDIPQNNKSSCPISREQCDFFRESFEKRIDIEIRSRLLDFKIDIQRFIQEEISRNKNSSERSVDDLSKDINEIFEDFLKKKYGDEKNILK